MLVSRDQRVEVEGTVGAQGAQGLVGEGKRESRRDIGLGGDGQKGREGTEKNLDLERALANLKLTDGSVNGHGTPEGGERDPRK